MGKGTLATWSLVLCFALFLLFGSNWFNVNGF